MRENCIHYRGHDPLTQTTTVKLEDIAPPPDYAPMDFRPTVSASTFPGTWVIPHPHKGRPSWLHRVMARILLGWEWRDG